MGDYFKPWRRKVGVVTLVMACSCLAWWGHGSITLAKIPVRESLEYEVQTWENFFAMMFCSQFALISACLLLTRPRKSTPKKITESIANERT